MKSSNGKDTFSSNSTMISYVNEKTKYKIFTRNIVANTDFIKDNEFSKLEKVHILIEDLVVSKSSLLE